MPTDETADAVSESDWYSDQSATFGDRVVAAREALSLSETDLAKRLGIGVETLRRWEDDLSEPRANKLQMLSGVLNVSLRWLLTGEGDGVEAPVAAGVTRADMASLLVELRQMRVQATQTADRLGVVEKRLRRSMSES